jgi:hypothetical protein
MARQVMASTTGLIMPVFVNETRTAQEMSAGPVFINETSGVVVTLVPYNPWPQMAPVLAQ